MLTEDQVHKVKQTMMTAGWNEVMQPAIINRGNSAIKALLLSPVPASKGEQSERQKNGGEFKDTDDVQLRAIIKDAEWMVACWQNEVKVFEMNRQLEELQSQQNGGEPPSA